VFGKVKHCQFPSVVRHPRIFRRGPHADFTNQFCTREYRNCALTLGSSGADACDPNLQRMVKLSESGLPKAIASELLVKRPSLGFERVLLLANVLYLLKD
jgi:hypothetical protein